MEEQRPVNPEEERDRSSKFFWDEDDIVFLEEGEEEAPAEE